MPGATGAALLDFRVTETPPFSKVGVDFAGPLFIEWSDGKGIYCFVLLLRY